MRLLFLWGYMEIKLSRSQLERIIDDWIINDTNCERNRSIIKDRLFNGYTHDKLAEKYGLSTQQIKNVISKCRKIILEHMENQDESD